MAEILTKNVIRADELLQLLRSLGIEAADISRFAQAYGFKKPKKVQVRNVDGRISTFENPKKNFYVKPTADELKKIKAQYDVNILKKTDTGPGKVAFDKRVKRANQLLKTKKYTIDQVNEILKSEFPEVRTSGMKSTLTKLAKNITGIPSGKAGETATVVKRVKDDLNKLNKSEVKKLLKAGETNVEKLIKKTEKILNVDDALASRRIGQLIEAYSGDKTYLDVKDDLLLRRVGPLLKNLSQGTLFGGVGGALARSASERKVATDIGKPRAFFTSLKKRIQEMIPGTGIEVDEIKNIRSSAKFNTSPYSIFLQGIRSDLNQEKGKTLDKQTTMYEKRLQNAKTLDEKKLIAQEYNAKARAFARDANKNLKPGQLPVRVLEISFDKPDNVIKNKSALDNYGDMFDDIYKKHGYSFKVPADVKTVDEIRPYLEGGRGKGKMLRLLAAKAPRIFGIPAAAYLGYQGVTNLDKLDPFTSVAATEIEPKDNIEFNKEIGAFVDPKTDDKVSQATLLDWAANNPMPTAAVASAPLLSKTVRKGTGKLLKGLLSTLGSPTAAAGFAGLTIKENLDEGKNIVDATVDPLVGVELLFPELAKRATTSPTGTGLLSRAGRFLLNPIPRVAAAMTPVGIGITALGIGKELYNVAQEEQYRINEMRENDPMAYQEYLAEQQELMDVSA